MFNLRKYYLFIISIIISISFMVSCSKATDPSYESAYKGVVNTTTNTNVMTVWCGPKSQTIAVTEEALTKIWRDAFSEKTIYSSSAMTSITGRTDAVGNYYDNANQTRIRTSFRGVGLTTYLGRVTVCGIYYDEVNAFGNRWRKIIITPNYVEQAAYGSGSYTPTNTDGSLQSPTSDFFFDTGWVWYAFIFGVMEH